MEQNDRTCQKIPDWLKSHLPERVWVVGVDPVKGVRRHAIAVPVGCKIISDKDQKPFMPLGDCCYIAYEKNYPLLSERIKGHISQFRLAAARAVNHWLNPLHVYSRLKDLGLSVQRARRITAGYERRVYAPHIKPFADKVSGSDRDTSKPLRTRGCLAPVPVPLGILGLF